MRLLPILAGFVVAASPGFAALTVHIAPVGSPGFLVGTPIAFKATTTDGASGTLDYRFSVSANGQPYQVMADYNSYSAYIFTPSMHEGSFSVQVTARNKSAGETATDQVTVNIKSRVTDDKPVINATGQPLVALYSAPACPVGSYMLVYFGNNGVYNHTDARPCQSGKSMNFYIAGMLAKTTYFMFDSVVTGSTAVNGPVGQFTTGSIPSKLTFPADSVVQAPGPGTATQQGVVLLDENNISPTTAYFPVATDLNGKIIWFYGAFGNLNQGAAYFLRPLTGGTMLAHASDPNTTAIKGQLVREIDLAGNTVRETNATRVTEQLNAMGMLGIIDFDHDTVRLNNGHWLVVCSQEKIFPTGTQGSTAPVDILGDAIVDLDQNLQVVWAWSGYDHLDINRAAILGETCTTNESGCPPIGLASVANDWLHANSINYIPSSGDILLSLRHQDWLIKINYNNGQGDGTVIWKMGVDGNFTINSTDPYPWFSHQHDAEFELNGTSVLSLFDNGNTRSVRNPGVTENSRGYVLSVDEPNLAVTPILLQDLGIYSMAVGSAQRLDNGDYHFTAGFISPPNVYAQNSEYSITGVRNYLLQDQTLTYRGYRMDSLYQLNSPSN